MCSTGVKIEHSGFRNGTWIRIDGSDRGHTLTTTTVQLQAEVRLEVEIVARPEENTIFIKIYTKKNLEQCKLGLIMIHTGVDALK